MAALVSPRAQDVATADLGETEIENRCIVCLSLAEMLTIFAIDGDSRSIRSAAGWMCWAARDILTCTN